MSEQIGGDCEHGVYLGTGCQECKAPSELSLPADFAFHIGRIIHKHTKPKGLLCSDWDSGAVLGRDNAWRNAVMMAAEEIIACYPWRMANAGKWWCQYCMSVVDPVHVTYEETHDECGGSVQFCDPSD